MPKLDAETERALRDRFAGEPVTLETLAQADDAFDRAYRAYDHVEKTAQRERFVGGLLGGIVAGYLYDKIALFFGMPEEWLLSSILTNIWHKLF